MFPVAGQQLRGLNVVNRELGATRRTVNTDNLQPRPAPDIGVGASPSQLALRQQQQQQEQQAAPLSRPSTAPGRLPPGQQQALNHQQQRDQWREMQLRQQQRQAADRLPEPRSPTSAAIGDFYNAAVGGGGGGVGGGRGALASSSASSVRGSSYHYQGAADGAMTTTMPRLGATASNSTSNSNISTRDVVNDAHAAEFLLAVDLQFPAPAASRPQTADSTRAATTTTPQQQRAHWLRPATAQPRATAPATTAVGAAAGRPRTVEAATPHLIDFDGSTTGGDRPETTTDPDVSRAGGKRRPHTAALADGRSGSSSQHHHRYALAVTTDDKAAGAHDDEEEDSSTFLSTNNKRTAARGKPSLGRLFVGSAPLLPVTGNDVNEDASMRISVVPQVRNPEVFAPVVERRGRLAGRKGRMSVVLGDDDEEDPADVEMRAGLQTTLQTVKMKIR